MHNERQAALAETYVTQVPNSLHPAAQRACKEMIRTLLMDEVFDMRKMDKAVPNIIAIATQTEQAEVQDCESFNCPADTMSQLVYNKVSAVLGAHFHIPFVASGHTTSRQQSIKGMPTGSRRLKFRAGKE